MLDGGVDVVVVVAGHGGLQQPRDAGGREREPGWPREGMPHMSVCQTSFG